MYVVDHLVLLPSNLPQWWLIIYIDALKLDFHTYARLLPYGSLVRLWQHLVEETLHLLVEAYLILQPPEELLSRFNSLLIKVLQSVQVDFG